MKKRRKVLVNIVVISIITFSFLMSSAFAQEGEKKVVKRPVTNTFEGGMLIENPTIENPDKGGIQFIINHRFGSMINSWDDIFGIYAPSNIYMGVNYGILDNLSIGFATEKNNKLQEFHLKWNILNQHRANGSPVAITYYGNFAIDARKEETFGSEYKFSDRLSYFSQIIIARKFSDRISFQIAPSYTHFNSVDTTMEHDAIGIAAGGRVKIWNDNSFIIDYSYPIPVKNFPDPDLEPKPNLGLGIEFTTGTHVFQVFATNSSQLVSQKNYLYNKNKFNKEGILLGFNILVRLK